ncbi:hypothetical protein TNCV_2252811 [Trichonephila clavipes]|nr:hypothetical protein TNCV_2252811 [Trichonephila clavipes]
MVNRFLFTIMIAPTKPISSNSFWRKGRGAMRTSTILPGPNPPDYFFFPRLNALNRKRLDDIPNIQRNVMRLLNFILKEDFLQSFQNMYSRSQRSSIVIRGNYFEGQ